MPRNFDDADKTRKLERIQLSGNPAGLPEEILEKLRAAVTSSLKNGYLPCPAAWKIAKDHDVPKIAVGAVLDSLGHRVTDCQLGCFKVDKTPYDGSEVPVREDIAAAVEPLCQRDELTCTAAFEIARRYGAKPMDIANIANMTGCKIRRCQLGCF